jgi:chemotaxis protein CheD
MAGSPTIAALFTQRVVVGVGDMAVSNNSQVVLSTYALGSCVGVVGYDPVAHAGGLLHLMLPDSSISPDKAAKQPAMFANTGLPLLFRALFGLKADPANLRMFVAGGASVIGGSDPFKIGERNSQETMSYITGKRLVVVRRETGGNINRTLHLDINTGKLTMKTPAGDQIYSLKT